MKQIVFPLISLYVLFVGLIQLKAIIIIGGIVLLTLTLLHYAPAFRPNFYAKHLNSPDADDLVHQPLDEQTASTWQLEKSQVMRPTFKYGSPRKVFRSLDRAIIGQRVRMGGRLDHTA